MPIDAPEKLNQLRRNPVVVRLLLIALLAETGYAVLNISAMPMYLTVERSFGASLVGFALVGFLLSEAIFKGPMGHLADRYGRRLLMGLGPTLTVGTSLLTLAVPKGWGHAEVIALVLLRVFDGVGAAMLWPAAFALMGDTVDDARRQKAMSLLNLCYILGVALALPLGGLVNDLSDSKSASLYLAAGLFLTVAIVIFKLLPNDGKASHSSATEHGEFQISDLVIAAKKIPSYLLLSLITFAGIGFPMAIIKLFAQEQYGMSESKFGFLIVLPGALAMAMLSVPMAKYGEKIGRVRAVHLGMGMCASGLTMIALGGFFPVLQDAWAIGVGGIPVGLGFLLAIPAWMASVSDLDPKHRAANLGAVMTAQGIGAIIGAPIGAWMYDAFGGTALGRYSPLIGCAACVIAGWLTSLRILRPATDS